MSTNLDVLRRARGLYSGIAVALPDRQRRVLAVAGLNVLAVGLAFGALHVGGVIVSGNRQGPLIAAVEPRDDLVALPAASAPSPHLAPTAPFVLAASVGADILYAEPLLSAASFGDGSSFPATGRFVAPPGSVAPTSCLRSPGSSGWLNSGGRPQPLNCARRPRRSCRSPTTVSTSRARRVALSEVRTSARVPACQAAASR